MRVRIFDKNADVHRLIVEILKKFKEISNVIHYMNLNELASDERKQSELELFFIGVSDRDMEKICRIIEKSSDLNPACKIIFMVDRGTDIQKLYLHNYTIVGLLFKPLNLQMVEKLLLRLINNKKNETENNQCLQIKNRDGTYYIPYNDILYLESQNHYVNIYTHGQTMRVIRTLYSFEEELPANFRRCHKGYIVNIEKVKRYSRTEVKMVDGSNVLLGRKYMEQIKNAMSSRE